MTDAATLEPSADDEVLTPHGRACAACGAPVDAHDRFCNACGLAQELEVVEAELIEDEQRRFRCENCGAEVATDLDQRSYVCAFCDSTYVIELPKEATGKQRPEFVIGFAVTPEQAKNKFRAWLNESNWFRPGDLSSAHVEDKQRGVYLPFWSFSMLAQSRWSARIGEYWYRTETYTTTDSNGKTTTRTRRVRETEWWHLSGKHHRYHSGYLVSGSRGQAAELAADLAGRWRRAAAGRFDCVVVFHVGKLGVGASAEIV